MTNRLELNWKLDGFVDEQRYYCSETPINPESMPTPKAILASDVRTYVDTDIVAGKTYFVRIGSVKNEIEKISDELSIVASSTAIALLSLDNDFSDKYGTLWTNDGGTFSTSIKKFGDASLLLNGSTASVSSAANTLFALGSEDFTFEAFIRPTKSASSYGTCFLLSSNNMNSTGGFGISLSADGKLEFRTTTSNRFNTSIGGLIAGAFNHFSISRIGNNVFVGLNGTVSKYTYNFGTITGESLLIGMGGGYGYGGYVDELRLSKGIALYTENYTVPTQPF